MQLSDELRSFLEGVPLAALSVALDLGHGPEAVLVVKSTRDLLGALRGAAAPVDAAWVVENTDHGPVACFIVRVRAPQVGELLGEIYFDASSPPDLEMLGLLVGQENVRAVFLDDDVSVSWVAEVPWDEVRRLEAEQVADRIEELLERSPSADFEAAKRSFQDEFPLDRIVSRAFAGR